MMMQISCNEVFFMNIIRDTIDEDEEMGLMMNRMRQIRQIIKWLNTLRFRFQVVA